MIDDIRYRLACCAIAVLSAGALLLLGPAATRAQESCSVLDDCSGVSGLPSASVCEEDDCTCAQQVECYLRRKSPTDNWPRIPDGKVRINSNFFHDRFFETRISPRALKHWERFADPGSGPVDMPDGTVLFKSGFLPKSNNLAKPDRPALSGYVFVKIDGYCPDGSTVGDFCLGGDWFSMEVTYDTYGILEPGEIDNEGKSTRCFACHAAAERGDWLWQLYSRRRYP